MNAHGRRMIFPLTKLIAWRIRIEYSILPDAAAPSCPSREELTGSSRFFLALLLRLAARFTLTGTPAQSRALGEAKVIPRLRRNNFGRKNTPRSIDRDRSNQALQPTSARFDSSLSDDLEPQT